MPHAGGGSYLSAFTGRECPDTSAEPLLPESFSHPHLLIYAQSPVSLAGLPLPFICFLNYLWSKDFMLGMQAAQKSALYRHVVDPENVGDQ